MTEPTISALNISFVAVNVSPFKITVLSLSMLTSPYGCSDSLYVSNRQSVSLYRDSVLTGYLPLQMNITSPLWMQFNLSTTSLSNGVSSSIPV